MFHRGEHGVIELCRPPRLGAADGIDNRGRIVGELWNLSNVGIEWNQSHAVARIHRLHEIHCSLLRGGQSFTHALAGIEKHSYLEGNRSAVQAIDVPGRPVFAKLEIRELQIGYPPRPFRHREVDLDQLGLHAEGKILRGQIRFLLLPARGSRDEQQRHETDRR